MDVVQDILRYRHFIRRGGVTLSGGEPLMQPDFCASILEGCREHSLHTALDTSGAVSLLHCRKAVDAADMLLLDIKAADDALFRRITGLRCPGCGVTRMCLALLRGDLAAAWAASPGLLLLSPFLGLLLLDLAVRYVRTGQRLPGPVERAGIWCAVAWLVLYGVIRNLAGF